MVENDSTSMLADNDTFLATESRTRNTPYHSSPRRPCAARSVS